MRRGHVDIITHEVLRGWAADDTDTDARVELRVSVNGHEIGRIIADRPRTDLAAAGRFGDGAHGFTFFFPEPLVRHIDNRVTVYFADDGKPVARGDRLLPGVDREPIVPIAPSTATDGSWPTPIMVAAASRSGTTYLMSCLAASPHIAVASVLPYELRLLDYYAAAHGVLTAPADWVQSLHPDKLHVDRFHIGHNPFTAKTYADAFKNKSSMQDLFERSAPERLGDAMASIVREFYRRLAADELKSGTGRPTVIPYFAEKNINLHWQTRLFVRRTFPVLREIAIVRDPRDILCSYLSYYTHDVERSISELTGHCTTLMQMSRETVSDLLMVRYEDMLMDEEATFTKLSTFLGVPVGPVSKDPANEMFKSHATSPTPSASIGRWRSDLPQELQTRTNALWRTFLERFGYDLA